MTLLLHCALYAMSLTLTVADEAQDLRDRIFFAMADRRYAVLSMEREENTLESVFLSLTEEAAAGAKPRKEFTAPAERDGEYELIDDEEEEV